MNIAKQIRIQKLQNKNRMVGKTFNPAAHTSESLKQRELDFIIKCKSISDEERRIMYNEFINIDRFKDLNNIHYSNSFEHNVFMRHFKCLYN